VSTLFVRQFVETMPRIMGSRQHSDSIGNDCVDMFIVNTDGAIEYPDYLRAHQDGGSRTRFSIETNNLDEVRDDPLFARLLSLKNHLPAKCRQCREHDVCGGGFLAGRCDSTGFNPRQRSVLCYD